MSTTDNKQTVRRCWETCFNQGQLAILDELVTPDFRWHGPGGQEVEGAEGTKQLIAGFRAAFPDLQMTFEDQIAEGDKVVTRWTMTGSQQGPLPGLPPTGKPMRMTGIIISRLVGGQIAEEWESFDQLGMLQQLGAVPTPGQSAGAEPAEFPPPSALGARPVDS